ncbi:MAG: (2Fe-2S) ferredoxin domain-containing protein [Phycisphaerae bacterium]
MDNKIKSPADLKNLRDKLKSTTDLRQGPKEIQITVHMGTCGIAAGARDVLQQLASELGQAGLDNVTLRNSGCIGLCDREPMISMIDKNGEQFRYGKLDRNKVHEIVQKHLINNEPVLQYTV